MAQLLEGKIEGIYRAIRDINNAASDAAKRQITRRHIEDLVLHLYLLLGDLVLIADPISIQALPSILLTEAPKAQAGKIVAEG